MNNQHIPADKINEFVARYIGRPTISIEGSSIVHFQYSNPDEDIEYFEPLTNHNQFHELWTAAIEAKACDVLDDWLRWYESLVPEPGYRNYWHHPDYKANRRLWQLRAVCEVMNGI